MRREEMRGTSSYVKSAYNISLTGPTRPPLSGEGRRRIVVRAGHESQNLVAEADRAGPWMAATNKPTVCTFSRGASASVRHRMTWPVPISNEA